ncbi:MAG: O-antigen ligase family protein [Planctomycetota bacterium]
MRVIRTILMWVSAIILVAIPVCLLTGKGGVLHESQAWAALAIMVAASLSLAGLGDSTCSSHIAQHKWMIPLAGLVLLAICQTIPLPANFVGLISPGSVDAYQNWLPALTGEPAQDAIPISVCVPNTGHAAAGLAILLPLAFATSIVFHGRGRLTLLLSAVALTGLFVAVAGIVFKIQPELCWVGYRSNGYATFTNRNNAALLLNLGMAASLGLLAWRMNALHNVDIDDPEFEFDDLVSLVSDRDSFLGMISGIVCLAGLLINGSRGGIVAAMFGLLFAFGYVRPRRGLISFPVIAVVMAISVAFLTVPLKLDLESIRRFEVWSGKADTLQNDARLPHWRDGLEAASAHWGAGSGIETYRYAHLPFLDHTPGGWFYHADNLWLEWVVETGVVGLALVIAALVIAMFSLRRLGESADPIDQGIRVTAWYAIGATVVSQFFDFGLSVPANLFLFVMLMAAAVSRDIANGGALVWYRPDDGSMHAAEAHVDRPALEPVPESVASDTIHSGFRLPRFLVGSPTVAVLGFVVVLVGFFGWARLTQDARAQRVTLQIQQDFNAYRFDAAALQAMQTELEPLAERRPDTQVIRWLANVLQRQGELHETIESRPQTPEQALATLQQVQMISREAPYPPERATTSKDRLQSYELYQQAWSTCLTGIQACPLNQRFRSQLFLLSAVGIDDRVALTVTDQLRQFSPKNAPRLARLASRALGLNEIPIAEACYRQALAAQPRFAPSMLDEILNVPELNLDSLLPGDPEVSYHIATGLIQRKGVSQDLLLRLASEVSQRSVTSVAERAQTEFLVGRLVRRAGKIRESLAHFQEASRLEPDRAEYRMELIDTLRRSGDRREALQQARMGRRVLPDDARFENVIREMAEEDRNRLFEMPDLATEDPQQTSESDKPTSPSPVAPPPPTKRRSNLPSVKGILD